MINVHIESGDRLVVTADNMDLPTIWNSASCRAASSLAAAPERFCAADLHYFDVKSGAWHTVFVDAEHASVVRFTDEAVGENRIVLDSHDLGDEETRWSFNDIRPGSFGFRAEVSGDGGKTWRLQSDYHMNRRCAVPHHAESRHVGCFLI